jgi:hypothetical protein
VLILRVACRPPLLTRAASCRYWELIELARKLVLNGVVVLCNQGTILQLAIALVIVMLHMILVLRAKPMRYKSNNAFYSYTK